MSAEETLFSGDIKKAYSELAATIRSQPEVAKHRIYLFQLQCVMGNWKGALSQLDVLADLSASSIILSNAYKAVIQCELYRENVFAGKSSPIVFGEPVDWIAQLAQGLKYQSEGQIDAAAELNNQALEKVEPVSGYIDSSAFEWIADADMRLGPILELIVEGKYYWVPFDRIRLVEFEPISDLRDKVWRPVTITWVNEGISVGFIPSRYPGISNDSTADEMLCKITNWVELKEHYYIGVGQKVLCTNDSDISILDVKKLEMDINI